MSSSEEDDRRRRESEISVFAKLASGDTFRREDVSMNETDNNTPPSDDDDSVAAPAGVSTDVVLDSKAMFAAAAKQQDASIMGGGGGGAGTFCKSTSPNANSAVASSNLDAAVAALTNEDGRGQARNEASLEEEEEVHLRSGPIRPPPVPTPMYNEKVLMPRPLFFGPLLPPRVIREAREVVAKSMEERNLDLSKRPRLSQLPPHVRNVVGAIQAFGYGVSIFPCDVKDDGTYRGNEYLSTFQPVWGDVARAERERLLRLYGLPSEPSLERDESGNPDELAIDDADADAYSAGEQAGSRNSFSADDMAHVGGASIGFPNATSPTSAMTKSLLLRSKSAPVMGKAPKESVAPPMSDNDQFLKWARGKPVTPPRKKSAETKRNGLTEMELFSQWARGKSVSPELEIAKKRSFTSPDEKDLFSKWARGEADQSPTVTQNRKSEDAKVETVDGAGTDVAMFSMWAQGGVSDSPEPTSKRPVQVLDSADSLFTSKEAPIPISDKNQFSQWAGGNSPATIPAPAERTDGNPTEAAQSEKDLFSKWANGESGNPMGSAPPESETADKDTSEKSVKETDSHVPPPSEQDMFSQWARAGQDDTTNEGQSSSIKKTENFAQQPYDTFCALPTADDDFSDDGSVDRSEMKKKVGINENLNSALASITNEDGGRSVPVGTTESINAEEANALLAQIGATTEGGRPLTNFEITNGLVPLFACDDSTLPAETDLGIYQTKEDQMRDMEQRRSQGIIDKHTYPNIFGPVACPNPAQGPDDSHSWNSRAVPARRQMPTPAATGHQTSGPGIVPVLDSSPAKHKNKQLANGKHSPASLEGSSSDGMRRDRSRSGDTRSAYSASSRSHDGTSRTGRRRQPPRGTSFDAHTRFGWWNASEEAASITDDAEDPTALVQLPHVEPSSSTAQIATGLTPTPDMLHLENRPLSELHAATSVAGMMPFLSDRPPSFRYLQIDTEAVGFPALGGEIEPFFCSLAIYHVESTTSSHDPRAAPVPNIQRCGRVTEVLTFDVVRDPEVEEACFQSLWPCSKPQSSTEHGTQGSRCGVFPLASNLNVANLYAILIVHKVLSENEDVDVYIKASKPDDNDSSTSTCVDIRKLREKAARASSRQGEFMMPFAFGVAPLLQIFGTDIPKSVSSRAVQIPLFRFINGYGERPIIDHIMVMLYPRADHRTAGVSGPAPLTNSGTAMLVMRNFGYLGLHKAVFSKGSLRARDRLVDFSGEIQVRRVASQDSDEKDDSSPRLVDGRNYLLPPWHKEYVTEPAVNGGRNLVSDGHPADDTASAHSDRSDEGQSTTSVSDKSSSIFYAKEMAPVPLKLMQSTGKSPLASGRGRMGRSRAALRELDVEPTFHTTFCNELLCQPRLLHKSPKGHIAIKVELREMEWNVIRQTYIAHTPRFGPSLHNPRRGPFLVQDAFTACSFQANNAHFMDEFKIKLPLILDSRSVGNALNSGPLALFFTVYKVDLKSKRSWHVSPRKGQNGSGDVEAERKRSKVRALVCGFLPITTSDTSCLIDNGLHDVKLMYTAEKCEVAAHGRDSLVLSQIVDQKNREGTYIMGRSADTTDEDDKMSVDQDGSFFGSESAPSETATESDVTKSETSSGGRLRPSAKRDSMGLQVRIVVHSSVHPQNATLNEFLCRIPDTPVPLSFSAIPPSSPWKLSRPELQRHIANADIETEAGDSSDEMQKLLLFTVDLSKSSLCSAADSSSHFFRIFDQLVRTLVSGSGTPSLLWANPASVIPLRMHAFATLLQIVYSVNAYMVRNGCTQLDGKSRWNLTSLGRMIAVVFDEEEIFSADDDLCDESIMLDDWKAMFVSPKTSKGSSGSESGMQVTRRREKKRTRQTGVVVINAEKTPTREESLGELLAALASTDGAVSDSQNDADPKTSTKTTVPTTDSESSSVDTVAHSSEFKIDSKADFQSNLWAGSAESSSSVSSGSGSVAAQSMIKAFGGVGPSNRRKWMTAPSSGLATIREDADASESDLNESSRDLAPVVMPLSPDHPDNKKFEGEEPIDRELIVNKSPVRTPTKMRVPRVTKSVEKKASEVETPKSYDSRSLSSLTVPSTDEEIFSAGSAFLDTIGKNLGISGSPRAKGSEEQRVGQAHHRKTRSRCSIDWTIPDVDVLMGDHDSFESPLLLEESQFDKSNRTEGSPGSTDVGESTGLEKTTMVSLSEEERNTVRLPNYLDRLVRLGNADVAGRWCPYAYEVIIIQWVALLVDQRRSAEKPRENRRDASEDSDHFVSTEYPQGSFSDAKEGLSDAAIRARGVAISCTPVLLEIIKKSIGSRVHCLHNQVKKIGRSYSRRCPPLVSLDEVLLAHLEQLVCIITDACLDRRNFDSWEFRQTCIDVNDSIIRFLRDMFAFLQTGQVHRLILVYLSRFVVRDGKHRQDKDSKIGLRCSWEISKLRLNAVTTLVRFPDFIRVNSPQMQNWSKWSMQAPPHLALDFFRDALKQLDSFSMPDFSSTERRGEPLNISFPSLQPHWLAEVVTDICLSGTEHAEQYIQHRAGSLLSELFWSHSQEAKANGTASSVATMYVPFLRKVLGYTSYLASMTAKDQLRKDIIPCATFVMNNAPDGVMRALCRELCLQAEGKGRDEKFGGVADSDRAGFRRDAVEETVAHSQALDEQRADPDIFDMFGLLNLALSTFEFEGSDEDMELESLVDSNDQLAMWKKEFLLGLDPDETMTSFLGQGRMMYGRRQEKTDFKKEKEYSTTSLRKWNSHDASLVIIHTSRIIVREMVEMQRLGMGDVADDLKDDMGATDLPDSAKSKRQLKFSSVDIIIFVRAATSVYLHSMSLRQSDIAIVKTLDAAVEIVKIFGIKVFLRAVGETLQHWMRIVSYHCGARRADVRVQSLEFLWLVLRLTWDSYGSFLRVRLPLLSVQTEVMERIVATCTARNYREQRRMGSQMQSLPNDCAEASLSPLWRTLDRLHRQSASQNLAFRSALIRLAESMKKLYRAYIAAHALAIVNRARSPLSPSNSAFGDAGEVQDESSPYLQSRRIVVHRIINASAGYSKQFLGLQRSYSQLATVAHNEAMEDAFLDAAYVFSPTELPTNRVAWLRKLADFHATREKYAEEATCHFHIHITLRQAARLHHSLWANIPFVAWTVSSTDGLHLEGDGPAGVPEDFFDTDFDLEELTVEDPGIFENSLGKQIDKRNSFRRQFYRVANSLRMSTGDPEIGGNKNLFYGVTFPFEYRAVEPTFSLKQVEEELVDEAEMAGNLFLKAGIAESSRFAWSLATQIYAEKFNYGKLAHAYRQLANVVSSNVPVIDTTSHALELSHPLGRFYRVWFHGGAPDEINGTEFVYRAAGSIKLDEFGDKLRDVIKGILPKNTPIDLVLDDGGRAERIGFKPAHRRPLGPTPSEPVKIKVTPLRPLLKRANQIRGTPEWFYHYIDFAFAEANSSSSTQGNVRGSSFGVRSHGELPSQREYLPTHHSRTSSASVFASGGSMSSTGTSAALARVTNSGVPNGLRQMTDAREQPAAGGQGQLVGVDKFSFLQPARKDRTRQGRDAWLKNASDIADKSLRVTQLQVEQSFPACVARQTVMHRTVFHQSPLEAGIDAVCSWCSVLFRTAVASNGMAVLGAQEDHGIGSAAAKVVAESMYSGKVKEMGLVLLHSDAYGGERNDGGFGLMQEYDRLSEAEVAKLQRKLARAIVVFMEILHLLIARNRDLLLEVMEARKRGEAMSTASGGYHNRAPSTGRSTPEDISRQRHARRPSTGSALTGFTSVPDVDAPHRHADDASASNFSTLAANDKTDKNIAVQSELQRTFIGMAKHLYNPLSSILGDETPRWLKEVCKDTYFSSSVYRRAEIEIRMANEIYFYAADNLISDSSQDQNYDPPFTVMSIDSTSNSMGGFGPDSVNGSQGGRSRGGTAPSSKNQQRRLHRGVSKQSSTVSALTGEGSIFNV